MSQEIEQTVKQCQTCQIHRPSPAKAPLHPWERPRHPWSRIHIDHAGPFLGNQFLIVVDAYSRWIDVLPVSSSSSTVTITKLQSLFATHGIPEQIVSDNGPGFVSEQFHNLTNRSGIKHTTTSPYHPSSNGLAERAVQTFKMAVTKLEGTMEHQIARFLLRYCITPQTITGKTPSEMLMGRKLRT